MTKIKVSPYLFAIVILVGKIQILMTHIPFISGGFSFFSEVLGTILSTAICMIFLAFFFGESSRFYDNKLVSAIVFLTSLCGAVSEISSFASFSSDRFSDKIPEIIIVTVLLLMCLYASYLGIEGITRSGGIIIFMFLIMFIVMISDNFTNMNIMNLKGSPNLSDIKISMTDDLFSSFEIIPLIYLKKYVSGNYRKCAVISLVLRAFLTILVTFAVLIVLGDYSYISDYPFLDMGSMGEIKFLQRTDSLYVILWVVVTVISTSLQIFSMSDSLKNIFTKCKFTKTISVILIFSGLFFKELTIIYPVLFQ